MWKHLFLFAENKKNTHNTFLQSRVLMQLYNINMSRNLTSQTASTTHNSVIFFNTYFTLPVMSIKG